MKEISLLNVSNKKSYVIKRIEIDDEKLIDQLKNLGFVKGNKILVRQSNYGKKSFLVSVMGINYALDKTICERIFVNE